MRSALVTTLVLLAASLTVSSADDTKLQAGRDLLMKKKLEHAQKLLEGIAIRDFSLIEKHADSLALISKKAEFLALKTPDYTMYSDDFRRNAERATKMAREKNLDGAALAYVQLTMNCVNCHKHVREIRMTRNGDSDDRGLPASTAIRLACP
jgi:cytochrome c556